MKIIKILFCVSFLCCYASYASAGRNDMAASDYIRPINELIAESEEIRLVRVISGAAGSCGIEGAHGVVSYSSRLIETFKGTASEVTLDFCGFTGLEINRTYLIAFDDPKIDGVRFFSPDGVFLETIPGEYFRLLSYESSKYEVGGRSAIVKGFEEKDILEKIRSQRPL